MVVRLRCASAIADRLKQTDDDDDKGLENTVLHDRKPFLNCVPQSLSGIYNANCWLPFEIRGVARRHQLSCGLHPFDQQREAHSAADAKSR